MGRPLHTCSVTKSEFTSNYCKRKPQSLIEPKALILFIVADYVNRGRRSVIAETMWLTLDGARVTYK